MKYVLFLCGAFMFLFLVQVHAQQAYPVVYDLWYNTTLYPETGDDWIRNNQAIFNERFHSCLNRVQERAAQASEQHIADCNQKMNPQSRAKCKQNDEAGKLWTWARTMRSVTRGEVRWSNTMLGQTAILGKTALEQLNPGEHERIIRSAAPGARQMLTCQ